MSARGSRNEVGFAAALQDDLSIFLPGIMPAGEVIERADGSRLSVHFLGEVPPGEVFKTRRGNTIARAGHGRVVLLGGLHELDATCFAEEAAAAGPSIAESLPGAIWSNVARQLEHAKQFLAEARRAEAAAAAESSADAQLIEHGRALRLYEAAHMLSARPGHLHGGRLKVPPWPCLSSAPALPPGAPNSSRQSGTPLLLASPRPSACAVRRLHLAEMPNPNPNPNQAAPGGDALAPRARGGGPRAVRRRARRRRLPPHRARRGAC